MPTPHLELGEGLLASSTWLLLDLKNVETHRLGKWPALADCDHIALLEVKEARRGVGRHVGVALLKTVVLPDVVEVVTTQHYSALHLLGLYNAGQDAPTN